MSLRDVLRQGMADEEVLDIIKSAVARKKKHHAGKRLVINFVSKLHLQESLGGLGSRVKDSFPFYAY